MPRFPWQWVCNTCTAMLGTSLGTHSSRGTSCPPAHRKPPDTHSAPVERKKATEVLWPAKVCRRRHHHSSSHPIPCTCVNNWGEWMPYRCSVGPFLLEKGLEGVNGGRRLGRNGLMPLFFELLQASGKHSAWKRFCQSKQ